MLSRISTRCLTRLHRSFSTFCFVRCGLVATLNKRPNAIPSEKFDEALAAIYHRGPDHVSRWTNPTGTVVLGHTRLSIIDLQGGHQPISNEKGDITVIVNGELYDFERIRDELQQKGYKFKTKSDSEILLHLYEEHGIDMFPHLRGEFAFVVWDEKNQTLLFGRDRFGIKPLFYAYDKNGTLCLASELKALFKLGIDCIWHDQNMLSGLAMKGFPIFKGISRIPPGCYAVATLTDPANLRVVPYWDLTYEKLGQEQKITEEEAKTNVRRLLSDAIKFRLRADVPVGVYLSGGLDSCTALALSNTILKKEYGSDGSVDAFSISFADHEEFDEAPIADRFAKKYNAKFHKVLLRQQEMIEHFEAATYHAESFNVNMNYVAKYALSKAVRENGYKVVISGEGSDEMFLGYPTFKNALLQNELRNMNKEEKEQVIKKLFGDNLAMRVFLEQIDGDDQKDFLKLMGYSSGLSWIFAPSGFSSMIRDDLKNIQYPSSVARLMCDFLSPQVLDNMRNKWHPVYSDSYIWCKTIFQSFLLASYGDRMELANSVEVRTPFLDHHLVDYVNQLPVKMKIKPDFENNRMIEKYILREAVKDLLNDELYNRIKHPFFAPPMTWKLDGAMTKYIQETLRSAEFRNQPFFDQKKVIAFLDKLPQMPMEQRQQVDMPLLFLAQLNILQRDFKPKFEI
jgi:asparagine synthase (glutamine-hydrolysing)